MDDMSSTSLQPTSNNLLTNNNNPKELFLDKHSDDQKICHVGPKWDITPPLPHRKPNRKAQEPQQEVCAQEKDYVPVLQTVVTRKASLTSDSEDLATQLTSDFTPSCDIKRGDSSVVQDTTANTHTGDHKHRCETESAQNLMDVIPPPQVKKRDHYLSPETGLFKLLRKKDKKTECVDSASLQTEIKSICSKDTGLISCTEERPKEHKTHIQESSHVVHPSEIKGLALKTESDKSNVEQIPSLSILKKIHLPQRSKKLSSSKSEKEDSEKGITAQQVTNRGFVKSDDTGTVDMKNIKHAGDTSVTCVETMKAASAQKHTSDTSEISETTYPIPRPRVRKRISGFFSDNFTAKDSTSEAFHREEAQATKQNGQSSIYPTSKEQSVAQQCNDFYQPFPGDQCFAATEEKMSVPLRRTRLTTDSRIQPEDAVTLEKTLKSSILPLPRQRVKKCLSDSFPYNVADPGSSLIFQHTPADNLYPDKVQQNKQSGLPVPLPRAKKRLSATYSDTTEDNVFHLETQLSQSYPEGSAVTDKEIEKGSVSLNSNGMSEGGFVTVQEDNVTSELEQEVLAAMQEDVSEPDSSEDSEKTLDEVIEDWTFTDKPVVEDESEKTTEMVQEQANMKQILEAEVDKSFISIVASSQDDWLHVEDDKQREPMEKNFRKKMRDEDVEFGFVSVDVTAGCLEDQR